MESIKTWQRRQALKGWRSPGPRERMKMSNVEMKTIEEWAAEKHTASEILKGTMILAGWGCGKSVSEKDYDNAVKLFTDGPADGRKLC